MMNEKTRLLRHPDAVTAEVGGDVVFLHEGDGQYYSLSEVAALAWKMLAAPRTLGEVVEAVVAEYEASEVQVREDLERLFRELEGKGMVQIEPGPGQ